MSRNARRLILAGSFFSFPFGTLTVGLPLYLKFLEYPAEVIGLAFAINGGVAVLLTVPFGLIADQYGRKRMGVLGGFVSALAFLLLIGAPIPALVYIAAAVGGVAEALEFSTLQALLAEA